MAADPQALFKFEPANILAKLHLAGQQQAPNITIINSAIDPQIDQPNPENIGKCKFKLNGSTDLEYQILFCAPVKYKKLIDVNFIPAIAAAQKKLKAQEEKVKKLASSDSDDEQAKKDLKKYQEEVKKAIDSIGIKYEKNTDNYEELTKNFNEALEKENQLRLNNTNKAASEIQDKIVKEAEKYFETAFGKEQSSKAKSALAKSKIGCICYGLSDTAPTKVFNAIKDFVNTKDFTFDVEKMAVKAQEDDQKDKQDDVKTERTMIVGIVATASITIE